MPATALLVFAAGFITLTGAALLTATLSAAPLVIGLIVAGFGAGVVMTLGADAIMSSAPTERAGQAGAIQETSFELGAGLGIAIFGIALNLTYRTNLPALPELTPDARVQIGDSLGGATDAASRLGDHAPQVLDAGQGAFIRGFAMASITAAALPMTATLAAIFLRTAQQSSLSQS